MLKDFKKFILRGNMLDLAVAVDACKALGHLGGGQLDFRAGHCFCMVSPARPNTGTKRH